MRHPSLVGVRPVGGTRRGCASGWRHPAPVAGVRPAGGARLLTAPVAGAYYLHHLGGCGCIFLFTCIKCVSQRYLYLAPLTRKRRMTITFDILHEIGCMSSRNSAKLNYLQLCQQKQGLKTTFRGRKSRFSVRPECKMHYSSSNIAPFFSLACSDTNLRILGSFTSENLHAKCGNGRREHAWPLRASHFVFP